MIKSEFFKILQENFPIIIFCLCIGILSGYFLNSSSSEGFGILLIAPAIMTTTGNIGSIFGSQLTTALHSGVIGAKFQKSRVLFTKILGMVILSFLMSILIGFCAYFISLIIKIQGKELIHFLLLTTISGLITSSLMILISIFVSYATFSRGLDPDNFVTPLVSTLSDFISVLIIIIVDIII
ncbi:MAG: magnesium transporter [Candidatus Helarchaeota archaeon]|nr:magnesium transporter [Candidatus Helarchaeota archaeon]